MSREFWIGLVAGLVIGWVIEWLIDWCYWRKKYAGVSAQLEETKDDLTLIKGVGKTIEGRLNAAGIYSFRRLSKLTQPEIEKIIGKAKNLSDEEELIHQAKKMAKKMEKKKGK